MKLSSKFSTELIIKARIIKLALNENGVEKTRKALKKDVFRNTQFSDTLQKNLWTQMNSAGTVNNLVKFACNDTDAKVMQWLEKKLDFSSWPEKRFVKMNTDSTAKTMNKDFQRDFPLFSKKILKRCIQKLKKPGSRNTDRPDPVTILGPDAAAVLQEAELVGITHKYFVDDKFPEEVSGTQNKGFVAATTNPPAEGPRQIPFYHEFFGPDGRRIIEQIQIPIIKDMRGTAEVAEASSDTNAPVQEHVEETSDPVMQEVQETPKQKTTESKKEKKKRLKEEMAARVKQEYEDMDNQYWEAEEEEDRWTKSLRRFDDENLSAPSNPKVEELKKYVASLETETSKTKVILKYDGMPPFTIQQSLLSDNPDPEAAAITQKDMEIRSSVIISAKALENNQKLFPQYALFCSSQNEEAVPLFSFQRMGRALSSIAKPPSVADPRLFINTTIPWSFFVCGLQGSGKSHSTGALLESCLIPTPILGHLQKPLSGLVLHYSQYATASAFQPCEAAFLSVPHPDFAAHQRHRVPVTVLVSPSNYHNLKAAYAGIPGVTVKRLLLHPAQLNISAMLALMAVDTSDKVPLYMSQIQQILRDMAEESRIFDYRDFIEKLEGMNFAKAQRGPLEQRLSLLESFLDLEADGDPEPLFNDQEGSMTIIDLSCPFVDENLACVMFDICLGLFLSTPSVGKVVAVDEAHKYITNTPGSRELTNSLLSLIRQQRHFGVRTIISTQEPTIDPRLVELSNVTLMHRFTSPEWFARLKRHIGIGQDHRHTTHLAEQDLFSKIVNLRTGEAYAFAPSAMAAGEDGLEKLGGRLLKVKTRKRVTWDGGRSILSVD